MLVTLLRNEIRLRGAVPYYGTAFSHIASQRTALRAGFLPAWTELYAEPAQTDEAPLDSPFAAAGIP